ncbi:MAG: hypothetical protein B7Z24_07205 [Pseudomonadales bacterium 32-42-5]|nr:MAG: hypothetical protein B7Z24_07205 [Pseudomonadales bacterium 32-42-5]
MISIFSKKYDYPVFIENEANLSALAEYTYSSDKNRLININIKSGIGAGIAQLGELQKGSNGRFGEIGQTILFPNGAKFPCGNNGCLELYASTEVLYNNIRSKINLNI